jgi:hypothetical protein
MSDLKHIKVVTPDPQPDGSVMYTTESYYEQLSHKMIELQKELPTNKQHVLQDIISCLDHLFQGSPRLVLTIDASENEPIRIVKRWLVSRESFKRR